MSLDKAIEYGKEKRKRYRGSKRFGRPCRNHGDCDYRKGNRLYSTREAMEAINEKMKGRC